MLTMDSYAFVAAAAGTWSAAAAGMSDDFGAILEGQERCPHQERA